MKGEVQTRLRKLYEANGNQITPEIVLQDATKKTSPLHSQFEWDDRKAAHLYRLKQAQVLIAHCIDVETDAREYVYIPSQQAFVATVDAVQSAPVWREAVAEMDREITCLIASKERIMQMAPKRLQSAFSSLKKHTASDLQRLNQAATAA